MEGSVLDFGETVMFTAVRASSKVLKNKNVLFYIYKNNVDLI